MSGCGCNINKKSDQCTIVPEYLTGCNKCGDKHTWDTMECAYICRTNGRGQRVMDIYRSLVDNTVHVLGSSCINVVTA